MNFISLSTTQLKASLSYFRNDRNVINFEASRDITPSVWLTQVIQFLEKNFANFWEKLNYIALDVGPGSFTGIKVGVAFVQALSMTRDVYIVPVNSLEALAYFGINHSKVAIATNAHRNLFYFSVYYKKNNKLSEIIKPSAVSLTYIKECLDKFSSESICLITDCDIDEKIQTFNLLKIDHVPPLSFAIGELSKIYREHYIDFPPENITPCFIRQPDVLEK
jgi:tRNA threonylcarbamoyladenosine biosynthesis protein TsaB